MNTTSHTSDRTVKAWLQAGQPFSYAKERGMTQLSEFTDSTDPQLCQILFDFAQKWSTINAGDLPPTVIHYDERTVALFVRRGCRKGEPMFSPKRAAKERIAASMPQDPAEVAISRKTFERWRKKRGHVDKRDHSGRYMTSDAREAWSAWQASRAQFLDVPAPSAEVLVSEHQKAYEFARMQGKGVQAAELEAVRAIQAALLPAQARTLNGQHDVHMAA